MHVATLITLLISVCALTAASAVAAPLSGRGDPLLNPLFQDARQQSFSSMRLGEQPGRLDVGVGTVSLAPDARSSRLHIRAGDSRFNTTGQFLAVENATAFRLDFGGRGVMAFAFNFGGLDRDLLVELFDERDAVVERFWVRALVSADNPRVYMGAYSPYAAVHYAVFTFAETNDAFGIDNLTVMEPKLPSAPNPLIPLRAAADAAPPVSVPDTANTFILLFSALAGMAGIRRMFRPRGIRPRL